MRILISLLLALLLCSCNKNSNEDSITLYTHRHYPVDQRIFDEYEEATGVKIKVVKASADELMQRMASEGSQSSADLLMTVDAGRLVRAQQKGLLQPIVSDTLEKIIPAKLRASDNSWMGLTKRARVVVYHPDRVAIDSLSTYEQLADPQWKGRMLIRNSENIYNQSLLASLIAHNGSEGAEKWAKGMVSNFARTPKGNDRDQVKAIAAGEGDLAIINTYYLGQMITSPDPDEARAGESVRIFFPNQDGRGTHINISGVGLARHAPNPQKAVKFIEYLASKEVQELYASVNHEYPVNAEAESSALLKSWGDFRQDELPLEQLGELNRDAVTTFGRAGWQ